MKRIVLFGANCGKCKRTEANIKAVMKKYNIEATFEKTEDLDEMVKYNVHYLPTVMINEKPEFKGTVPSEKEILKVLQ